MAQIRSRSSPLRDLENKVPQCPSTIPRGIPALEVDSQTLLPLIMPTSKSTPRSSRSPNTKLPYRTPSSSSGPHSPNQLEESNSNYVFESSRETSSKRVSSDQNLSHRPRCLETWDASSLYTNTPSSSGLSRPYTPPSYTTASKYEEPVRETTKDCDVSVEAPLPTPPTPPINSLAATIGHSHGSSSDSNCSIGEEHCLDLDVDLDPELGSRVWVDDVDGFETKVLQAVGYDCKLAARLIPQLYVVLRKERSAAVGSWSADFQQCAGDSEPPHQNSSPIEKASGETSGGNNKKRQARHDGSDDDLGENQDGNDGEEEQNSKRAKTDSTKTARFACPFHKWRPDKYNKFYESRACQGPGFVPFGRLKEHLERVHLNRQCLRCALVFSGKDRVADLLAHQRAPDDQRCQLNTQSEALKEGIDSVQWDKIVRLIRSGSNSQGNHSAKAKTNVEKWMEIWDVLFPNTTRPATPWYDAPDPSSPRAVAKATSDFSNFYGELLRQMINEEEERPNNTASIEHEKSRFREIAIKAFQMCYAKLVVEHEAFLAPLRDSNASDIQGAPNSSKNGSDGSMNPGARQTPQRVRQGMSAKLAGKQRAASYPENLTAQDFSALHSPAYGSAETSSHIQSLPNEFWRFGSDGGIDSFPYAQPASAAPQNFRVDQTGPSLGGPFDTRAQMTTQTGGYGPHTPFQAALRPGNSFGGIPTYPPTHNQNTPSVGVHPQHNSAYPQFVVPQYQGNQRHNTYAANKIVSPDSVNFPLSPTSHPVNVSSPNNSGYPNFAQGNMNGMPYWMGTSANGN